MKLTSQLPQRFTSRACKTFPALRALSTLAALAAFAQGCGSANSGRGAEASVATASVSRSARPQATLAQDAVQTSNNTGCNQDSAQVAPPAFLGTQARETCPRNALLETTVIAQFAQKATFAGCLEEAQAAGFKVCASSGDLGIAILGVETERPALHYALPKCLQAETEGNTFNPSGVAGVTN